MAMPPKPGDPPQRSPGRSPNLNLPCPLPPVPAGAGALPPGAGGLPPPRVGHHRRARSEVAFRFPDDLGGGGGGGGGFDEIGSEDDLFSTFMDMDKIAGADRDRDRDRAAETSSPPRPAKHRHSASFDGFGTGAAAAGLGGGQDAAGGVFGEVMEAKKAMSSEQLAELAAIDPKRAKR